MFTINGIVRKNHKRRKNHQAPKYYYNYYNINMLSTGQVSILSFNLIVVNYVTNLMNKQILK